MGQYQTHIVHDHQTLQHDNHYAYLLKSPNPMDPSHLRSTYHPYRISSYDHSHTQSYDRQAHEMMSMLILLDGQAIALHVMLVCLLL
jgi:hypothetical protein